MPTRVLPVLLFSSARPPRGMGVEGLLGLYSLGRALRRLHLLRSGDPVDDSLRGWNWFREPLRPRGYLGLSVAEVAYRYCPTRRDVWLRRIVDARPQSTNGMIRGRLVHEVFARSAKRAVRLFFEEYSAEEIAYVLGSEAERVVGEIIGELGVGGDDSLVELGVRLYRRFGLYWAGWVEETGSPPWLAEYIVDGSVLGLSRRLRVDALAPFLIVEVKYGGWRDDYPVALAGYALALESMLEAPVDYGVVVLVDNKGSRVSVEPVYIGNQPRISFIQYRDELIDMLLSREEPSRPPRCPEACPFTHACRGEGGGGG